MSISALLPLANEAPLMDRADLRRPAAVLANTAMLLLAVTLIGIGASFEGEANHIVVLGIAPMVGAMLWPLMEAFRFHEEKGFSGVTGLDAFLGAQAIGVGMALIAHAVLHGAPAALVFAMAIIPFPLWAIRAHLDRKESR